MVECTDTLHRFLDFLFLISKTEVMKYYLVPEVEGRVKLNMYKDLKGKRKCIAIIIIPGGKTSPKSINLKQN